MLQKAKDLVETEAARVYFQRYSSAVEYAEQKTGVKLSDIPDAQPGDTKKVLRFFHYVWEGLPDHHSIRCDPFFDICDLAEAYFNWEDDYNESEPALPAA